jgi:hypothetical protein
MAPERRPLSLLGEYWTVAVDLVRVSKWVGCRRENGTAGRGSAGGDVASDGGGTRRRPFRIAESSLRGLGED